MKFEHNTTNEPGKTQTFLINYEDRTTGNRIKTSLDGRAWIEIGDRVLCIDESNEFYVWGDVVVKNEENDSITILLSY